MYDRFWREAMRSAYRPLTLIEQAALLPLCVQNAGATQEDRWWAAVGVLRLDGASRVAPLTLARLERVAADYWEGERSPDFSMKPGDA